MEKNCLVTELKGTVNNSTLPMLGCLRIVVNNASNNRVYITYAPGDTVYKSTDIIADSGVSVDFSTPSNPLVSGTGNLYVKNKYNFSTFAFYTASDASKIELGELFYCNNLHNFTCPHPGIVSLTKLEQLSVLPASLEMLSISISNSSASYIHNVKGNITDVGTKFVNVTRIGFTNNVDITGTMTEIATIFPSLTNMGDLLGLAGFTGDIIDFVKVRRYTQNVSSDTVQTKNGNYCGIKFNGNSLASGEKSFTWTPNSGDNTKTDITYNGTTITIDSNGNVVG